MLTITKKAQEKIAEFGKSEPEGKVLRIYVEGGGCAGFQYGLAFDDAKPDDNVTEVENIKVAVDPLSAMYISGATIDYVEGLMGSGFKVTNPNSSGGCGCGHSFAV